MITEENMKKYAIEAIKFASVFIPEPDEVYHSNEIHLAVYVASLAQILLDLSHNKDCAVASPKSCPKCGSNDIRGMYHCATDNSDYTKCAEEIYNATFSSSDIFTVEKIEQILKTHFAQQPLPDPQKNKIIMKCPRCKSEITEYYDYSVCRYCGWNIDK